MSWGCSTITNGNRIEPDAVLFITPGITTKPEILENLGPPFLDLDGGRLIAYYWGTTANYESGGIYFLGRTLREPSGPKPKEFAFCVALDEDGRVIRSAKISKPSDESLREAVLKWHSQTR